MTMPPHRVSVSTPAIPVASAEPLASRCFQSDGMNRSNSGGGSTDNGSGGGSGSSGVGIRSSSHRSNRPGGQGAGRAAGAPGSGTPMQVILGSQTIRAFVAAPKEFNVIGIVRMGQEFGLLAEVGAGHFVRVNGSTIQALCGATVAAAIAHARNSGRGESYASSRIREAVAPATVVVRKRRRIVQPDVQARAA